jgi:uncharacterized protein
MSLRDDIMRCRDELRAIADRHGGRNLRLFGSVARREERGDSDIDLLIDLAPDRGFADYIAMVEEMERLLSRRVDLVTERGMSPFFKPYILAEAEPV